jgi:hypothetical protein
MERHKDAIKDLSDSLIIQQNIVFALVYRANSKRILEKRKEALDDINKVLKISSKNAQALRI